MRGTIGGEAARRRSGGQSRTRPAGRRDTRRPPAPPRAVRLGPHHWFAERLLAVVSGRRPVHSLLGHTVGPAYQQLVTLAPAEHLRDRLSPVVRQCGRFTPGPGVIEAFARIATGDRVTAMAFRLEQGPDLRWRCAAIEIQSPGGSGPAAPPSPAGV
ncbi:Rv3235 family protein [Streptomyces sp. NBC_00555]|uniref:Rv3235 family protein n=1 Tax=Streptomyces sp. NBC_00555 TaxID=2903662 RepID=UPI00224D58A6|nr:Rv3235 family protein [Streptomyces sp. NBC_00555]MCX5013649.1 Rv3235 family protein [Streptomyces sp. NBC_00555]